MYTDVASSLPPRQSSYTYYLSSPKVESESHSLEETHNLLHKYFICQHASQWHTPHPARQPR